MLDTECVEFLQWALPRLHMRWPGFRRVRGQVCKRLQRRLQETGVADTSDYRRYLETHDDEWVVLDALCRVTISRFYRDKRMFAFLEQDVLPTLATQALARGDRRLRIWSAGCGAGEEPYTLAILWQLKLAQQYPEIGLQVLATDADANMYRRAEEAGYTWSSIKNLPAAWRSEVFTREDERYCLQTRYRRDCEFRVQDVRRGMPAGPFDLVLCRNLVFTYFEEALQHEILTRMLAVLRPGGALVIGIHEQLPPDTVGLEPWHEKWRIYRKVPGSSGSRAQS